MSHGIEITNTNGDTLLDNDNEVILASEKGTISGTRSDIPSNNDYDHKWYYTGEYWECVVHLAISYTDPPMVAVRGEQGGYNILLPAVSLFSSTGISTDAVNRISFKSDLPRSVEYIVCCGASIATQESKDVGSDTYGLQIKSASNVVLFDSRWKSLVSCTTVDNFPTSVFAEIDLDPAYTDEAPDSIPAITVTKTDVDVTIPSTPGGYIVVNSLVGYVDIFYGTTTYPYRDYGGGIFVPTFIQTSATNITATTVRVGKGTAAPAFEDVGEANDISEVSGVFLVLRYIHEQ